MSIPLEFSEITQKTLTVAPWRMAATNRLPGLAPIADGDWLWIDDAYPKQMAYRDWLLTHKRDAVQAKTQGAEAAIEECARFILDQISLRSDFLVGDASVTRPDGVGITKDMSLDMIGRLIQQDICILEKVGDEHVMSAAVLCFPASWSLDEKIGRPMSGIHEPVEEYTSDLQKRVQRVFDAMRDGQGVWRCNYLEYSDPNLFQPRRENARRNRDADHLWSRVERQTLIKLPQTQAIVFGIHSFVVKGLIKEQETEVN